MKVLVPSEEASPPPLTSSHSPEPSSSSSISATIVNVSDIGISASSLANIADFEDSESEDEGESDIPPPVDGQVTYGAWGDVPPIDPRISAGARNFTPKLNPTAPIQSPLAYFLHFLPQQYLHEQVVPASNRSNPDLNMTYEELLAFIGIQLSMSLHPGYNRREFFTTPTNTHPCYGECPCFKDILNCLQYEAIISSLSFTIESCPTFADKFWKVCVMIQYFNEHMGVLLSWLACMH